MPRISVIIVAYNKDQYIKKTIESVLSQTYQDFEIIIVNNGSTDNTKQVIESINSPKIKYIELKDNQGASYAANLATLESNSEYIALLCADDVFLPQKLEKQIDFLDKYSNIGAVFTDINFVDSENKIIDNFNEITDKLMYCARYRRDFQVINMSRQKWLKFFLNNSHALFPSTVLMRKSVLDDIGGHNNLLFQVTDLDMWIKTCLKYEIYHLPEVLTSFRVNNNISSKSQMATNRSALEMGEVLKNYFDLNTEDIFKVFPELKPYKHIYEPRFKDFFIILALLMQNNTGYVEPVKLRATILKLYEFMSDNENLKFVFSLGLTIRDLIELTGILMVPTQQAPHVFLNSINNTINKFRGTKKRVILHGAGIFAREFIGLENLSNINIVGITDNDLGKRNSVIGKYKVYHTSDIKQLKPDCIILLLEFKWYAFETLMQYKESNNLNFDIEYIFEDIPNNLVDGQAIIWQFLDKIAKHCQIVTLGK